MPGILGAINSALRARGIVVVQTSKKRLGHSPGAIVEFTEQAIPIRFFIENTFDVIQRLQSTCHFYEREELDLLSRHISPGANYADIGANVGNHVVYMGKILKVANITAFEPNPDSLRLLRFNVDLNRLGNVTTIHAIAASDQDAEVRLCTPPSDNLGWARITRDGDGPVVPARRADDLIGDQKIDFIKIDVEGHELKTLNGLERTIATKRPKMLIEVDDVNIPEFRSKIDALEYKVIATHKRYAENENFLITPKV